MMKKRRQRRKSSNRFRFETVLPPEVAMERLHDMSPVELATLDYHARQTFLVESRQLDDTIYFEIQVMGSAYYLPAMLGQVIRGQIRAIDAKRTLVQGELRYSPQVKFIGLLFATLLGGGSILLFLSGSMPGSELLTIVGMTVVAIILIRVFATGKGGRNLTIDRIENQIRPLWRDQDPVDRRELRRQGKRSERHGHDMTAEEHKRDWMPQNDG